MNRERLLKIIVGPHVSEKSSMAAQSGAQYAFKVTPSANKIEIKQAVETLLDVKVSSVRVSNVKGKKVRFGRTMGQRKNWKKAYVTLAEGSQLDLGEMGA